MTAETQVHEKGAAEVSTNSKADQCGLDLPQFPAPLCNGRHLGADDPHNVIVQDDADEDNSYVFVTGNDDPLPVHDDLKDSAQVSDGSKALLIQNQDLLESSASASAQANNWVLEATLVTSSIDAISSQGDAFPLAATDDVAQQNATVTVADSDHQQLGGHQIESKPSTAPTENQECLVSVLPSDADSGDCPQKEIALEVSSHSNFVNQISREDNIESTSESELGQEPGLASLEATVTVTKSPEADISQSNPEAEQISQLSIHLGGTQDSRTLLLESVECASRQNGVQTVNSEEQSIVESASEMEAEDSGSGPYEVNDGGVQPQEEIKIQLVSNAKENQETNSVFDGNGQSHEDQGLKVEESMKEVNLPSRTETAFSGVLNENRNHGTASSVNICAPETKESNHHANDSKNLIEFQKSSESADSLLYASGCVEKETNNGEERVESVENAPDVTRQHEGEHEAPPCAKDVGLNTYLITKPETEDVTIESLGNTLKEHEIESKPSSTSEIVSATTKEVIGQGTGVGICENLFPRNPDGPISPLVNDAELEILTSKDVDITSFAGGDAVTSSPVNRVGSGNELETVETEEQMTTFQGDNVHAQTEGSGISSRIITCNDAAVSGTEGSDSSVVINENLVNSFPEIVDLGNKGEQLSGADINNNDELICQKSKDEEKSLSDEAAMSLPKNPSGQDTSVEPFIRPFQFLIRMPKFDNSKFRDQIKQAQLLVEEKTRLRDAFRQEVQKYKANCHAHAVEYEAAVSESRALKRSVKSKRGESDSLHSVINKVKNAISVEDIDARVRIYNMEHMIEHETLPLKEEKQFIREIKQLKQLREQLSSNIGSQDEVQQALNKRDQIEERLKILKKELDSLKDSVLKADAVARVIEKKYEDENKKVKEVQAQFRAADNVRQAAYAHFQGLRKELFEKNQQFRLYKEKAAMASDYAVKRDREALHHLCVNQVETIMELWNKNDEFRKEYIRCNVRNTLKRFGTLDGRSLAPNEEPPALATYGDGVKELDQMVSYPAEPGPKLQSQILEQENLVKPLEDVESGDKTKAKVAEPKCQTVQNRKLEKHILGNGLPTVSGGEITGEIREEALPTDEELQLARKAEELRKEEAAAKLKEQRRLEEKAKALEALERKKRNAEKAQMKAELRAQKEAEQREKEREKRLRKKERKKTTIAEVPDGNKTGETSPSSEILTETIKESGTRDSALAVPKRPQKPSQFTKQSKTKSIPPPLRNRNRRKIQQWMWVILTCLLLIVLFLLGNIGFFSNLSNLRRWSSGF